MVARPCFPALVSGDSAAKVVTNDLFGKLSHKLNDADKNKRVVAVIRSAALAVYK